MQPWQARRQFIRQYQYLISKYGLYSDLFAQFSMWSHDVISTSINLAGDLKIGQYLKVPPRAMFLTRKSLCLFQASR